MASIGNSWSRKQKSKPTRSNGISGWIYARKQVVEMLGYMESRQDMPISKLLGKVMSGISQVRRERQSKLTS